MEAAANDTALSAVTSTQRRFRYQPSWACYLLRNTALLFGEVCSRAPQHSPLYSHVREQDMDTNWMYSFVCEVG